MNDQSRVELQTVLEDKILEIFGNCQHERLFMLLMYKYIRTVIPGLSYTDVNVELSKEFQKVLKG